MNTYLNLSTQNLNITTTAIIMATHITLSNTIVKRVSSRIYLKISRKPIYNGSISI